MLDLESRLREQLDEIYRRAKAEAAPIIDKLVALEAAKPRGPYFVYYRDQEIISAPDAYNILKSYDAARERDGA